jgi:inner membrane transporter RhtA
MHGIGLTAGASVLAAAYLIFFKAGSLYAAPEALVLPMLLCAAGFNSCMVFARNQSLRFRLDRTSLVVALTMGALSALGNEAMAHALALIGPGLASVMLRTQVVIVAVGGIFFLGEKVNLRFWLGAALAMVGFALLQAGRDFAGDDVLIGMLWALVAAFSFGAMQVVVRKTVHRIDHSLVNSLRLWLAAGLLACVPGRVGLLSEVDHWVWLLCAAAGLVGPVISRLMMMAALRHVTAAMSTLVMNLAPVFAFAAGGVVFAIWPGWLEIVGSAVMLVGIALPVTEVIGKRLDGSRDSRT